MTRRAQVWSADFTFSLIIFSAATLIAFTIIVNTLDDREYDEVRAQAVNAAALLAREGYPVHWQAADVLRAGIVSDDRLSLRKATALAEVEEIRFRQALRITDRAYIYFTNSSNTTIPVFGRCGIGDLVVSTTPRNISLPAVGISSGPNPIIDAANVTLALAGAALGNLSAQDVIIIEGPIAPDLSGKRTTFLLHDAARRGITIVIIGDPGLPVLGIEVNATDASSLEVQGASGGPLLLSSDEVLELGALVTIPTIEQPTDVIGFTSVALTDEGKIAYATWIYGDARVWYLATVEGQHQDGRDLTLTLGNATRQMVTVAWPECGAVQTPDADQVTVQRRTIAHHDGLLQLNVLTWRSR
jgi:hypothetical protein